MAARSNHTQEVMKSGQDLIDAGHYASDNVQARMATIDNKWKNLHDIAAYRKKKIQENLQLQQFIAEYNDIMSWLNMMERVVANDDLGYDEASTDALLKKHKVGVGTTLGWVVAVMMVVVMVVMVMMVVVMVMVIVFIIYYGGGGDHDDDDDDHILLWWWWWS